MPVCAFLVMACVAAAGPREADACAHFDKGAKLIELHVYEAEGGAREGVAEGLREIKLGLEGGCPKVAEALRLQGDAAWIYASQHSEDREDGRKHQALALDSYRKYLRLRPSDSHGRFKFTMMLGPGSPEYRHQTEELVRRDPGYARGRHTLGLRLIEEGRVEAGARHLLAAAKLFDFGLAEDYGDQVVALLEKHGRKKDAAEAKRLIDATLKRGPIRRR